MEADASLRKYTNRDGAVLTAIDIIHRQYPFRNECAGLKRDADYITGRLELLDRKGTTSEGEEYSEEHGQGHNEGYNEEYSEGHTEEISEEPSKEHGKEPSRN